MGEKILTEHHLSGGIVLTSRWTRDPDLYAPYFNARISADRRRTIHTAYLVETSDSCIGLVWSMRVLWIDRKEWHWVSDGLAVSRRGLPTLYKAIAALHRHDEASAMRTIREARAAEDLTLMLHWSREFFEQG